MYQDLITKKKKLSVIGLGYVGLPIALEFAKHFSVIGFDINQARVEMMQAGKDPSSELHTTAFDNVDILFTSDPEELKNAHFHIVSVPTDIDEHKVPNLNPLKSASLVIGKALKEGDYVIYESTVYPGCTEEECLPILEKESGLKMGSDFKLGYSPERIVPGDKVQTLTTILKIVSGCDEESLNEIAKVYGHIITAGIYKATSIKVAEAAKVIENTQRDLNISLMNELSIIFDKLGIDTREVIDAASTKWNFIKLMPGLVGGHCIGVDPYYLLHKARQVSVEPQVIASGRRINDGMPAYIAKKLVQMLIQKGKNPGKCKVLMMGITFKENVSDIRNSKVVDLTHELMQYSVLVHIVDPYASPNEVAHEYKLTMSDAPSEDYDAVIVTVGHNDYRGMTLEYFENIMKEDGILMDIKGLYNFKSTKIQTWRL